MQIRRKPPPGEQPHYLAHSLYAAELGAPDPGQYRSTLPVRRMSLHSSIPAW